MAYAKQIDFTINLHDAQPLPYSEAIENEVLAALLDQPGEFYMQSLKFLNTKGMFYDLLNEEMYELIKSTSKEKLYDASKIHGIYQSYRDGVKFNHFLVVARTFYRPSEFRDNCLMLNEFWIRRTIHRMGFFLNSNSLLQEKDPLDLLGISTDGLDKIYRHISRMKEVTLKDGINELASELVAITNSVDGMLGIKGSISGLNHRIKGYRNGNLISVGATTGEGKTTLAIQEIHHMITQEIPTPVGCCSLEMKTSEYVLIMACDKLQIPIEKVLDGTTTPEQNVEIGRYMDKIKSMPLYISDKAAMKIGEIKALVRMWKKNHNIRMFFLDHGHLVEGDIQYSNAEQKFTDIANQLKALAKELDMPIMALWQLSRKEITDKNVHKISDIKYAGGVEQASDIVLLIYRPEIHGIEQDKDGNSTVGLTRIIVGKLRLLPKGDVKCHFTGTRFLDLAAHQYKALPQPTFTPSDNPRAGFQKPPSDGTTWHNNS